MDWSAFQLNKNNTRTNYNSHIHETPIVQYGRVIKVIDVQTVIVEAIIQVSLAKEVYTVTLLNLSSALLEINAWPKLGDTVLLLFLQRYDPRMFVQETVNNPNAVGYNKFSGVGILASAVKGFAKTIMQFYEDDGKPVTETRSAAKWLSTFNAELTLTFCRAVFDSEDEALISMTFGEGRPFIQQFLSTVTKEHGFWKNSENELVELDAAVTEKYSIYAPITKDIQGSQTIDVGLGMNKDGEPVETDAPVTETTHGKAPVTKIIRSPQDITIGIGNDETGDTEEQRDAAINIQLGEQADITLTSESGVIAEIERDVDILIHSNETINIEGDKEEAVQGSAKYSSIDTDIKSTAPIGLNDGLYATGLSPYLTAETAAVAALKTAAASAAAPLAILDALSGGTGLISGLGTAIAAFCAAIEAADAAAHTGISKAVK